MGKEAKTEEEEKEEEKENIVTLVGKLLTSSKHLAKATEWSWGGSSINHVLLHVGDIVMVVEEEEYNCYCKNKNNGMYACLKIAWLPRIALRFLTKKEELCGVDMPLALLHLLFRPSYFSFSSPGVEGIAGETNSSNLFQRSIEQYYRTQPACLRMFFRENSHWQSND